jgi:hypothetical protein
MLIWQNNCLLIILTYVSASGKLWSLHTDNIIIMLYPLIIYVEISFKSYLLSTLWAEHGERSLWRSYYFCSADLVGNWSKCYFRSTEAHSHQAFSVAATKINITSDNVQLSILYSSCASLSTVATTCDRPVENSIAAALSQQLVTDLLTGRAGLSEQTGTRRANASRYRLVDNRFSDLREIGCVECGVLKMRSVENEDINTEN